MIIAARQVIPVRKLVRTFIVDCKIKAGAASVWPLSLIYTVNRSLARESLSERAIAAVFIDRRNSREARSLVARSMVGVDDRRSTVESLQARHPSYLQRARIAPGWVTCLRDTCLPTQHTPGKKKLQARIRLDYVECESCRPRNKKSDIPALCNSRSEPARADRPTPPSTLQRNVRGVRILRQKL